MKKAKKILIPIAAVLIIVCGLLIWQRQNIAALKTSLSYSRDDISGMMSENYDKVEEVSQQLEGVTVRDLTDEERTALRNNEISRQDLIDLLVGKAEVAGEEPEPDTEPAAPNEQPEYAPPATPSPTPEVVDPNKELLAQYIAEIYLMKEEYTQWLEAKYQQAIDEYVSLPAEEQTTANKYKIGMRCMSEALDKEKECDARMAEMEAKIRALLQSMGESTELVDEIQAAYEAEKELKKAYYLGLHG